MYMSYSAFADEGEVPARTFSSMSRSRLEALQVLSTDILGGTVFSNSTNDRIPSKKVVSSFILS
jgi:hypothetical protein